MKIGTGTLFFLLLSIGPIWAQTQEPLENLDNFREQAGNWKIVGNVTVDPTVDVHDLMEAPKEMVPEKKKRRKKRKKEKTIEVKPQALTTTPGTGILINQYSEDKKDRIETVWQHGDIKLQLEVMLPKGSNSGIYLQGRYELQLKDSWGIANPKGSDMGGIHNNWETDPDKIFRGIPPSGNASKAPGLWQTMDIHFQAPKFNAEGEKIANAKFVSVVLNGVKIHSNIEVPHPTGGPISKQESAVGPLVFQGNHGPVAFRDIRYQLLEDGKVTISNLTYTTYKGDLMGLEDLDDGAVVHEGSAKQFDVDVTGEEDGYGLVYKGTLNVPQEGDYTFTVGYTGGVLLTIDGMELIKHNTAQAQRQQSETIHLTAGEHPLSLTNIKSAAWRAPRLGLSVQSASTNPVILNSYSSYPPTVNSVSPIFVESGKGPRLLRGFVAFEGDGERLSHTIGVGTSQGINYIYDLAAGNPLGFWRGDFVNATPMWHGRGDGSFRPMGAVQWTFLNQPLAMLDHPDAPFPKTGQSPDFVPKGYSMDPDTGLPIFKQLYKGVEIENRIIPNTDNTHIMHNIRFSDQQLADWYYKLAAGQIRKMPHGIYSVDDRYYVKVLKGPVPMIRKVEGEDELILPVDGSELTYEIIW
ncbi:MAG: family 16 glycoside hydrolase [Bacteroidota bacterium]